MRQRRYGAQNPGEFCRSKEGHANLKTHFALATTVTMTGEITYSSSRLGYTAEVYFIYMKYFIGGQSKGVLLLIVGLHPGCVSYPVPEQLCYVPL
jgi:hypothetical protein